MVHERVHRVILYVGVLVLVCHANARRPSVCVFECVCEGGVECFEVGGFVISPRPAEKTGVTEENLHKTPSETARRSELSIRHVSFRNRTAAEVVLLSVLRGFKPPTFPPMFLFNLCVVTSAVFANDEAVE